jgi:hypothetical protein
MARSTSPEEEDTRRLMTRAYKGQEHTPDGFDDWGNFTAHVVHAQRAEIERLRKLVGQQGLELGEWDDPLEAEQSAAG